MCFSGAAEKLHKSCPFSARNEIGLHSNRHTPAVNFQLGAGTYWLGLHNGPLATTDMLFYYWNSTSDGFGQTGREDEAPFGDDNWRATVHDHAFLLEGTPAESTVPEPATLTLATGLVGMAAARRKRRSA